MPSAMLNDPSYSDNYFIASKNVTVAMNDIIYLDDT